MSTVDPASHGESFPSTSWSALRQLRDPTSPEFRRELERLARLYWRPVYSVIRHRWSQSDHEAKDLTQDFFAGVMMDPALYRSFSPERGSFRGFLKGALSNFVSTAFRDAARIKRGGQVQILSLDAPLPTWESLEIGGEQSQDELFDRVWDDSVLDHALARTEQSLRAAGQSESFEVFRRYDLAPPGTAPTYDQLAKERGWSPVKVKRSLAMVPAELRDAVTAIVRSYVDGPEELEHELRRLLTR